MKMQSLQALRALAAFFVVGDHLPRLEGKLFPNGFMHNFGSAGSIGVDLFFVISGFIMISTTWEAFGKQGASKKFIARRFLRIYPAYWAALFTFLAIGVLFPTALWVAPMTPTAVISSFFLVPYRHGPLMFVAWSLEYELYFYIVFSLALRFTKSKLHLVLGTWCAFTLAMNIVAHSSDLDIVQFLGNPLALEFMGGVVVGYLIIQKHIFAPRLTLVLGLATAIAAAVYASHFDGLGTLDLAWFRVLVAGPAMMLIVYGAVALEERANIVPPRFVVDLGDASYSMYLWHGMLLGFYGVIFAHIHLHGRLGDALYIVGGLVFVILGSKLIYRVIELPLTSFVKRGLGVTINSRRATISTGSPIDLPRDETSQPFSARSL